MPLAVVVTPPTLLLVAPSAAMKSAPVVLPITVDAALADVRTMSVSVVVVAMLPCLLVDAAHVGAQLGSAPVVPVVETICLLPLQFKHYYLVTLLSATFPTSFDNH